MDDLTGYFTKEKDILYANQFTITEIAQLANVPESFVENVKKMVN